MSGTIKLIPELTYQKRQKDSLLISVNAAEKKREKTGSGFGMERNCAWTAFRNMTGFKYKR